jgi:NAD(P)-dependent dehydrogenase (short-subunit alcohol dehydrogenase family)
VTYEPWSNRFIVEVAIIKPATQGGRRRPTRNSQQGEDMRTIFITGASSGLGKATAILFSAKGWNVIATMRTPTKEKELRSLPNISVLELDVSNSKQIREVVEGVTSKGSVDVVLNNAGYALTGPLEVSTDEQVVTQINTNELGAILVTKAFIPHFRERKSGMFLTTTSIGGLVSFPLNAVYHATKWALEGFAESLAFELKPFNISVKTICPGGIKSDFMGNAQMVEDQNYAEIFKKMLVVFGDALPGSAPEQIADVVYEAATDGKEQLRYIAGADAIATYQRRLDIGSELFHRELMKQFLGESRKMEVK